MNEWIMKNLYIVKEKCDLFPGHWLVHLSQVNKFSKRWWLSKKFHMFCCRFFFFFLIEYLPFKIVEITSSVRFLLSLDFFQFNESVLHHLPGQKKYWFIFPCFSYFSVPACSGAFGWWSSGVSDIHSPRNGGLQTQRYGGSQITALWRVIFLIVESRFFPFQWIWECSYDHWFNHFK